MAGLKAAGRNGAMASRTVFGPTCAPLLLPLPAREPCSRSSLLPSASAACPSTPSVRLTCMYTDAHARRLTGLYALAGKVHACAQKHAMHAHFATMSVARAAHPSGVPPHTDRTYIVEDEPG